MYPTCDMCKADMTGLKKLTDNGYFTFEYKIFNFCPECSRKIEKMCEHKQ